MGQNESFCLRKAELQEALLWAESNKSTIPIAVYRVIILVNQLGQQLAETKQRASNLLVLFRKAIGVDAKSERGERTSAAGAEKDTKIKSVKTDEEKLAALKARRKKLLVGVVESCVYTTRRNKSKCAMISRSV
jgi:hypothetical protein